MSITRISAAEFNPDEELFLFGDETAYVVDEAGDAFFKIKHGPDAIFSMKHNLSFKWLAQYWQGEVPDEFFETEAASRKSNESLKEQMAFESGMEAKRVRLVRDNPVESALYLEWLNDYEARPISDRAIFSTALYFAHKMLSGDVQRDEKLSYIVDLSVQADNVVWGDGTMSPQRALRGYSDKPFPAHLLDE